VLSPLDAGLDAAAVGVGVGKLCTTMKARSDPRRGAQFFQTICANCHGFDGREMNFSGDENDPEFAGTVCSGNPWAALHKIRFGQPSVGMVPLIARPRGQGPARDRPFPPRFPNPIPRLLRRRNRVR